MPNDINNHLTITGLDPSQAHALVEAIRGQALFATYAPIPDFLDASDTRRARELHWGTKWDVYEATAEVRAGVVEARFCTAWSPPESGMQQISRVFPGARFTLLWWEQWSGAMVFENGAVHRADGGDPWPLREAFIRERFPDYDDVDEDQQRAYDEDCADDWYEVEDERLVEVLRKLVSDR